MDDEKEIEIQKNSMMSIIEQNELHMSNEDEFNFENI